MFISISGEQIERQINEPGSIIELQILQRCGFNALDKKYFPEQARSASPIAKVSYRATIMISIV